MRTHLITAVIGLTALWVNGALAATTCGANTGQAATGVPIKVGGIYGNAAPGVFSASTTAASAYFDCINANGGSGGRPIAYLVENDQWIPELAGQAGPEAAEG